MNLPAINFPIKSAVVGLGRAGWDLHLLPLQKHDTYQVVAVADADEARRKEAQEKTKCATYTDIDALLARADIDLVAIATPTLSHYSDAKKALLAGKHCVLEKPMALTSAEASDLVALAEKAQRILTLNHTHLFLDEFHHLKKIAHSGILGHLFHFRGMWAGYSRRWDWQTLKKNGGGLLNNWGTHLLSIALPILKSKVASVTADLQHVKDRGDTEDHVELLIKTESGISANLTVTSSCAFPGTRWMLLGEKGTLVSDGITSHLKYYDPAKSPLPPLDPAMAAAGREYNAEDLPWTEETLSVRSEIPIPGIYDNIADVLAGKAELISKPEDAAEIVRIIESAKANTL